MLPSQYLSKNDTNKNGSRSSSSSPRRSQRPSAHVVAPNMKQAPPLGITGVLCTSKTIAIPGRGTLHYTVYRPRLLQQQQQLLPSRGTPKQQLPAATVGTRPPPALPTPNPPLICVAGGPGMPCHYLTSLVHMVADRAVILYDHIGCGQSTAAAATFATTATTAATKSAPDVNSTTTTTADKSFLEHTVDDLAVLIWSALPESSPYHLFGHSFGGIVAFEYLRLEQQQKINQQCELDNSNNKKCLSVILASAPFSIAASHATSEALLAEIRRELSSSQTTTTTTTQCGSNHGGNDSNEYDDDDDDDDDDDGDAALGRAAHREFQLRHECRVSPMPLTLQQSLTGLLQNNNNHAWVSAQHAQLRSYVAQQQASATTTSTAATTTVTSDILPVSNNTSAGGGDGDGDGDDDCSQLHHHLPPLPPALIVRGQYDFVDDANSRPWTDIFSGGGSSICQYVTVSNCSHYGLVEQEDLYASVVTSFLRDHDP